MAYIVPSDISQLALGSGQTQELDTLAQLKSRLSSAYTVFHSVHWTREYAGHTAFGEIDFVVVNSDGDVLFIEQKNGPLEQTAKGLFKNYRDGPKDVVGQVHRSIDKVREKFKRRHGKQTPFKVDYLIYCPDYRVKDVNAAGLDYRRVVDAEAADKLPTRIEAILGAGSGKVVSQLSLIERFFQQTFDVVPDIHAHISAQEKHFTRIRGGLVEVISGLEMSPFRLRIDGVAGCGKSAVARYQFDLALENGRRPLFVCFNRPLKERIKNAVGQGGYVETWHGLCAKFLESQGHIIDYSEMGIDPNFWQKIQERVVDLEKPSDWLFDTLVVDEGQDFEQLWFDMLESFLADNADIIWLQDPAQNIRQEESVTLPAGFVGYRCATNIRTPDTIARFIRRYLDVEFECGNDLPGLGVDIFRYDDAAEQTSIVAGIVRENLRRGFEYDDIVVVSLRGVSNAFFADLEQLEEHKARRFTGEYDDLGNQVLSDGRLTLETIYRFKGQQAPAVVLVDVDPDPHKPELATRLLYAGMTRATIRLDIVARRDNQITGEFVP